MREKILRLITHINDLMDKGLIDEDVIDPKIWDEATVALKRDENVDYSLSDIFGYLETYEGYRK